jgi:perosamine synthetase
MTETRTIRLAIPEIDQEEVREVERVLASGYLTQGPKVAEFEALVAGLVGTRYAFATTSATTALHLSLVALGVGPGDEVIVPDFTFPATANVVVQQGARPIMADIDLATFAIDPDDVTHRITPRTRAIIPVHAFGLAADMDPILAIAREHGIPVIEDAACAIGATYKGRPCGHLGDVGCFSFHPRKAITTGEGGMITTDSAVIAERISLLRNHGGIRREGRFSFEDAGFNYRLSDILAAVGVAQFRKLTRIIDRKRALALRYRDLLSGIDGVVIPAEPAWGGHVFQSYVVMLDGRISRDHVISAMKAAGIETTLGTYALHMQPFFQRAFGHRDGDLPRSREAFLHALTLPLYPRLSDDDVAWIVDQLSLAVATSPVRPVAR